MIHAGIYHDVGVDVEWVHSQTLEAVGGEAALQHVHGIVVPGGFGERGIEGKIKAARFAREQEIPYLGLCLGMQVMVVEMARKAFDDDSPNSTEFDPKTPYPVISLLEEQQGVSQMGGTMRLGAYPCHLVPGTKAWAAYGANEVMERHRHRYEFNMAFREPLTQAGLIASGLSPDGSSGGDQRDCGASVHGRLAVPPGVSLSPGPAAPALPRFHEGREGTRVRGRRGAGRDFGFRQVRALNDKYSR